ncbi:MAG: cytochrome c biogenesis protein CcsA [Betaproteobacteria bacterium]
MLTALGYAGLAWMDRSRAASTASTANDGEPRATAHRRLGWALILVTVVHALVVWRLVVQPQGINLSFAVSLSLIGLLLAFWLWLSGMLMPVPGMAARTLPLVAAASVLPVLLPAPHWLPYSTDIVAAAQLVVALLAFALFAIAAVQAGAMLALQQDLHRGLATTTSTSMPPVLTLERWLFGLIAIGFVLLSATLASGAIFSEALFGKPMQFTHKTLFSGLAWLLFGVLLVGRWRWGWRGRQALRWVVAGSVLLLIGYAGSKFVLEVLLGRR